MYYFEIIFSVFNYYLMLLYIDVLQKKINYKNKVCSGISSNGGECVLHAQGIVIDTLTFMLLFIIKY